MLRNTHFVPILVYLCDLSPWFEMGRRKAWSRVRSHSFRSHLKHKDVVLLLRIHVLVQSCRNWLLFNMDLVHHYVGLF